MTNMIFVILILIIVLLLLYFVKTYNGLIKMKNRVKDQGSQIDVQLKRRYDLISNLVETVKGAASFEKETLEAVVNARANAMKSTTMQASIKNNEVLTSSLHRLLAVGESYPDLKASSNYLQLQQELSGTEDKIAKSRQFYNDTVLKYNNAVQIFPNNICAGIAGFKPIDFLEIGEQEKMNPTIKF